MKLLCCVYLRAIVSCLCTGPVREINQGGPQNGSYGHPSSRNGWYWETLFIWSNMHQVMNSVRVLNYIAKSCPPVCGFIHYHVLKQRQEFNQVVDHELSVFTFSDISEFPLTSVILKSSLCVCVCVCVLCLFLRLCLCVYVFYLTMLSAANVL